MKKIPLYTKQLPAHCGVMSLSYCLWKLGINTTQRNLAKQSKTTLKKQFIDGLEPKNLAVVAKNYRIKLIEKTYQSSSLYLRELKKQLQKGLPAIILIGDFSHWIAVLDYINHKFIICDPNDKNPILSQWRTNTLLRESWNENDDEEESNEPNQYCLLILNTKLKPLKLTAGMIHKINKKEQI